MTTIQTRSASAKDCAAIALLFDAYRQFYGQAPDLALAHEFIYQRLNNQQSVILVAETVAENNAQELLGFCQLYPTFCSVAAAPIFTLYDLYVEPGSRNSGAGTALLRAAEKLARASGYARMDLSTAKTNLPAQALYASLGWVRDELFYVYNRDLSAAPE